jgi:hypothetical protein
MLQLLQFIDRPHSPDNLKAALSVLLQRRRIPSQDLNALVAAPEQLLYPTPIDPPLAEPAQIAARVCRGLLKARQELPTYQLITFLAYTLEYEQTELATADKLCDRITQQMHENSLGRGGTGFHSIAHSWAGDYRSRNRLGTGQCLEDGRGVSIAVCGDDAGEAVALDVSGQASTVCLE